MNSELILENCVIIVINLFLERNYAVVVPSCLISCLVFFISVLCKKEIFCAVACGTLVSQDVVLILRLLNSLCSCILKMYRWTTEELYFENVSLVYGRVILWKLIKLCLEVCHNCTLISFYSDGVIEDLNFFFICSE